MERKECYLHFLSFAIVFDNIVISGGLGIVFGVAMYQAEKPKPPKDK
ncbi:MULTISPECIES: hypothetical protein [Paenibacillus]|nr:hypothetical protein [Paenibacillus borealis]